MALKVCLLFSIACFLLLTTKITLAEEEKSYYESKVATSSSPVSPPAKAPAPPSPPHTSKECVGPCWERCHSIKAKNIRPCMILCTRCCMKCDYVIPPTCKNWDTVTIEGHVYQCPK